MRKILSLILSLGLLFQQVGFAQVAVELNISNYFSGIQNNLAPEKFRPMHLRYFSYDNLNDNFKVILDKGDLKNLKTSEFESSTKTLLSYFLIGVSLPDSMFWVNLRPDTADQIIDPNLEKTDIGKIMLEADLQLKKDTAVMTSPGTQEGRVYWDKLYKKAAELYGYDNVTIPTLTRPWIVPGEIIVRESQDSAYVYKANLKVMLEQDYLKDSAAYNFKDERSKALNEYSSQLIRDLIIPKLTKEVNSSKRYAALRQVYHSLILSRWFKLRFTRKSGTYAALINSGNLANLVSQEPWSKTGYFKQYQKSFSEGEYNVKEPVYTPTGQVIRSYFSGGINVASSAINTQNGIILANDNANKLGNIVGGKAIVNPQGLSLIPVTETALMKYEKPSGKFKKVPGKNPQDAFKVIMQSNYLEDVLKKQGYFTLKDFLRAYAEEAPKLGYESLAENPESTARRDLYESNDSLVNQGILTLEKQDVKGEPYRFILSASQLPILGKDPSITVKDVFTVIDQFKISQWIKISDRPIKNIEIDVGPLLLEYDSEGWYEGNISVFLVDTTGKIVFRIGETNTRTRTPDTTVINNLLPDGSFLSDVSRGYAEIMNPFNLNSNDVENWDGIQYWIAQDVISHRILPLIDNSYLTSQEKMNLEYTIKNFLRISQEDFKRSKKDNPLHHSFIVLDIVLRIAFGENLKYEDIKKLAALAIVHDLGYGAIEESSGRVTGGTIKKMITSYEAEKDNLSQVERDKREGEIKKKIQDSMDVRKEHMKEGIPIAGKLLSDSGFKKEEIKDICRLVGIHDNPGIAKTYETKEYKPYIQGSAEEFLINKNDTLALIFREADRLWMLSYEGLTKDLMDTLIKGNQPFSVEEQFKNNISAFSDERHSYNVAGGEGVFGKFYGDMFFRTKTSFEIFKEYSKAWEKKIAEHRASSPIKDSETNFLVFANAQNSINLNTEEVFSSEDCFKISEWIRALDLSVEKIVLEPLGWGTDPDSDHWFEGEISVRLVFKGSTIEGERTIEVGRSSFRRYSERSWSNYRPNITDITILAGFLYEGYQFDGFSAPILTTNVILDPSKKQDVIRRFKEMFSKGKSASSSVDDLKYIPPEADISKLTEELIDKIAAADPKVLSKNNLDDTFFIFETSALTRGQKNELRGLLTGLYDKALPYFEEKKAAEENPIYHHTQVLYNMARIAFGQECEYSELKNMLVLALLHDIGNAISIGNKWGNDQIIEAFAEAEKPENAYQKEELFNRAIKIAKEGMAFRLEHMGKGPELINKIIQDYVDKGILGKNDVDLINRAVVVHDYPSIEKNLDGLRKKNIKGVDLNLAGAFLLPFDDLDIGRLVTFLREADRLFMLSVQGSIKDIKDSNRKKEVEGKPGVFINLQSVTVQGKNNIESHKGEYNLYKKADKDDGRFINNESLYRTNTGYRIFKEAERRFSSSSSPVQLLPDKEIGGIDFRALPMTIQSMGSFGRLNFKLPQLSQAELRQINIDLEMQQIKNMVQSGITPSGQRIKDLVAACMQKKEMNSQVDGLLLCLADIFKLEEENVSESSPELKEALVIVDSQS